MATVTGRYDGSSKFGQNNKYAFFPSVGLGWMISNEDFLKEDVYKRQLHNNMSILISMISGSLRKQKAKALTLDKSFS